MITDFLITLFLKVPAWVLAHLPTVSLPDSLTGRGPGTVYATIHGAVQGLAGIDGWIPVDQLLAGIALVLTVILAALAIRVVRIVASFLTLGGGA